MLKKPITYTDLSGEEVTEIFFFHLSKSEIIEWEVKYDEGLVKMLERIVETTDRRGLVNLFKELILKCYGVKSEDGKRFIKNDKLREEFTQTPAYDTLFMELATDDNAAFLFIQGVLPKDVTDGVDLKQLAAEKLGTIQNNVDTVVKETVATQEAPGALTPPHPPTNP